MPFNLPAPDETPLPRSPLALVVCQLRFPQSMQAMEPRVMLAVHQDLGGEQGSYPIREQSTSHTINIPVLGVPAQPVVTEQPSWRFSSVSRDWTVSLATGHVSLETSAYAGWQDFHDRFNVLLEAIIRHVNPELEERLGLRYVDRLTEPEVNDPGEWRPYINAELLGPALHVGLGGAVRSIQQAIDLDTGDDVQCSMRHGFFEDPSRGGTLTYLLDYDIYRQRLVGLNCGDVMVALDRFHTVALQLFQTSITDEMFESMKVPRG